jgi:signal transduction histidine kinase
MLRGLRVQLLLWTVLPLTLILGSIVVAAVASHRRSMRELVQRVDARTAQVAAAYLGGELGERVDALKALPQKPAAISTDYSFDGGVARFDLSGNLLAASPSPDAWTKRPYKLLLQDDTAAISPFFLDPASGRYMILIAAHGDEQVIIGAVSAESLGLTYLFASIPAGTGQASYLVDGKGLVVYHPDPGLIGQDFGQRAGVEAVLRGESGTTSFRDESGEEWAVGYAPVSGFGLGLVVQEPWSRLESPLMNVTLFAPLVAVAAAVVSAVAVTLGLRYVVRPLQALDRRASLLAWGDLSAIDEPVGGVQEIEDLRRTLSQMAHQVRRYQEGMRDYIGAITAAQEEERRRLARELHDETVQSLIALGHQIERAQKALVKDPTLAAGRLDEMRRMVADVQQEVRRFSRALRPLYLEDLGFLPALEMLVKEVNEADELQATLQVTGECCRLSPDLELAAYRIVQEALQNAVQHAAATEVVLTVTFAPGELVLRVADDGVGFEPPANPAELAGTGHFGLMGMRERALLFGGRLEIASQPGQGTTLSAIFPRQP